MVNNFDAVIQSEMARQPVSATVSLHTYVEEDARIVGPVMYASFNYTTSDGTASNETVITTVTLLFQHPQYAVSHYIHTYMQIYIAPKIVRTNLRRWHRMTRR